jgi:uncharacterized membrane protein YfcA
MDVTIFALSLGAVIGLVLALTGAGGGVLAIPLLVFGLHLPVQQAAPVGLVAVGLAAALGAVLGLRQGIVRYRAAALIGVAGIFMAPLGVVAAQNLPSPPLMVAFALVLIYTSIRSLRTPGANDDAPGNLPCLVADGQVQLTWTRQCARALFGTGVVSGFLSGLLGVGGGFVIVPALTRHTNLSAHTVQATSLAVIALVSVSGVSAAAWQGAIPWAVGVPFAGGAALGLLVGRQFAQKLNARALQVAFAWFALGVALLVLSRAAGVLPT